MPLDAYSPRQPMLCAELVVSGASNDQSVIAAVAGVRHAIWGYSIFSAADGKIVLHFGAVASISNANRVGVWEGRGAAGQVVVQLSRPIIGAKATVLNASVGATTDAVVVVYYTEVGS